MSEPAGGFEGGAGNRSENRPEGGTDAPRYSLRRRLLARIGAAFAVLLLAMSALLWELARRGADQTYDLLLSGSALAMLERVFDSEDGPTVDIPYSALDILALARDERVAYRVFDAAGRTITGEPGLPLPEGEPSGAAPRFFDASWRGAPMRFLVRGRLLGSDGGRTLVLVQIGQTRDARDVQQLLLFATSVAGLAAVALLGLLFVWFAISRALLPLAAIETDLRRRAPTDLSPLEAEPPREVRRLIAAINGFIARLRANRDHTEGFIADVAHQTRTSLSTLDGQLGLAAEAPSADEMRRRVGLAADQARRSVRLTDQLLAHAMVIHRADGGETVPVAVVALVRDLLREMLRSRTLSELPIGLDVEGVDDARDRVAGDPVALREALRNLVDNAVRHGGARGGGEAIDVAVRREEDGRIGIVVDDAGSGIPAARRAEALGRFVSLGPATAGSGLGLAIVDAVAASHNATFALETSPRGGLRARLAFPRIAAVALIACLGLGALAPPARADGPLVIWSATDREAIAAVVERFERVSPGTRVEYREFQTVSLHATVLAVAADPALGALPDVVVSSAMDLQVDLVNRGLARAFDPGAPATVPDWARWRSELYGFTWEPAALIYHRPSMAGRPLPATHLALADAIRDREDFHEGRIGTYDIRLSGIGYLFATQDSTQGQQFQRLTESLGRARARAFCCTSVMIDAVSRGELVMGVNVIGSYALAAAATDPALGVHFFDDYNLVMSRTAFVPAGAARPGLGERFVAFLLSADGQRTIAERSALLPIDEAVREGARGGARTGRSDGDFLPIRLGPGLLTWLDALKQARFVDGWAASMLPEERP